MNYLLYLNVNQDSAKKVSPKILTSKNTQFNSSKESAPGIELHSDSHDFLYVVAFHNQTTEYFLPFITLNKITDPIVLPAYSSNPKLGYGDACFDFNTEQVIIVDNTSVKAHSFNLIRSTHAVFSLIWHIEDPESGSNEVVCNPPPPN